MVVWRGARLGLALRELDEEGEGVRRLQGGGAAGRKGCDHRGREMRRDKAGGRAVAGGAGLPPLPRASVEPSFECRVAPVPTEAMVRAGWSLHGR